MSENSCGRHEISYRNGVNVAEISANFLKFRPILVFQILTEIDISFCFIFSFGFKPINPT